MKKKLLILSGVLLLVFAFTGCQFLVAMLTSISGTVVDAKSSDLAGVTASVTLTSKSNGGDKYTTTSDSDGSFTISNVRPGEYILSASAAGWFFAPKDVHVGGVMDDIGYILGFEVGSGKATTEDTISLILVWDENFQDVDLHFTYPEADVSSSHQVFAAPYQDFGSADEFGPGITLADDMNPSNGPTVNGGRGHIYYGAETSYYTYSGINGGADTRKAIKLDRDDYGYNDYDYSYSQGVRKGPRVETLSVNTVPYPYDATGEPSALINPSTANELPSGSTYRWLGVMELYADAYDSSHSSTDTSADYLSTEGNYGGAGVTLYVVQGSNLKGVYRLPDATKIKTASLVRINFFLQDDPNATTWLYYYQILPDERAFQGVGDIKALGGNPMIIGASVSGKSR